MLMVGALFWGSCAYRQVGQDESGAKNNESAGLFEKSELRFRISGMSSPFLSRYCLCSISRRQFQQIHRIEHSDFSSGRCSRRIKMEDKVSSVGTSPQQAMTTSGST